MVPIERNVMENIYITLCITIHSRGCGFDLLLILNFSNMAKIFLSVKKYHVAVRAEGITDINISITYFQYSEIFPILLEIIPEISCP